MGIILLQGSSSTPVVPAIGMDGTLLAIQPEAGATYTFSYRTDIHKSWDGRERRVALLGSPREALEADFFIDDEDTFRALRSHRARFPTDPYLMVVWHDGATAQGAVTSTVVRVLPVVDWLVVGQRVWIEGPDDVGYAAVIQAITVDSGYRRLDLDTAPPGNFADGNVRVYPLRAFYLEDSSPVGRYVVNAGQWNVRARAAEFQTSFGFSFGMGVSIATLGGVPYLDVVPMNRGLDGEDRPIANVDMMDAGAKVAPEWSFTIADIVRSHSFLVMSDAERQYWKGFFQLVMGRQKVFLLPTYRADIEAIDVTGGTITAYYDTEAGFADFGGHGWVRIVSTSGVATTHQVTSTDNDVDENGVSLIFLFLDPVPPALANIAEIQWIEKVRLASDDIAWTYLANGRFELPLQFVVVRQ